MRWIMMILIWTVSGFTQPLDTLWTRTYESYGNGASAGDIQVLSDGGFLVGGTYSDIYSGGFLLRLDASGDTIWTRNLGDRGVRYLRRLMIAENGDYLVVGAGPPEGEISSVPTVGRFDNAGNEIWIHHYP